MAHELPPDTLNDVVGVLTRREIEARLLGPLVAALGERFGEGAVREVLTEVIEKAAKDTGRAMREAAPDTTLEHFAEGWEPWFRGGALETHELERTPERWSFNVTRCRYAELYRALGMADLGATLSCNRDAALIRGFDDTVTLTRTQTLMEGASHCDFRYSRKKEGASD